MSAKTYNGWTNYETWLANMWLDEFNLYADEDFMEFVKENNRYDVGQRILDHMESWIEQTTELEGFVADMFNAAFSEIDWYSIADHYISEVTENV